MNNTPLKMLSYALLVASGTANAESFIAEGSSAPVLHIGSVNAYPGLSVAEKHDDNLTMGGNGKVISSNILQLKPSMLLQAKKDADAYTLAYEADLGRYKQSSADNYDDHNLSATAQLALTQRATLSLTPEYKIGHDPRGSLSGSKDTLVPNTFKNKGGTGSFSYGSEESRGRFVLNAGYHELQYDNNPTATNAMDRTTTETGGTFYYRLAPKTSALVVLNNTRVSYNYIDVGSSGVSNPLLSGSERRYQVGVTWDAAAQTSGIFKIGQMQKVFDSATHSNFKGGSWEGSVHWTPREYVRLNWVTGRTTGETTLPGSNFVLSTNNAVDFGYDLNQKSSLSVNAVKLTEDYNGTTRSDNTNTYGLKAEYKVRSWLIGDMTFSNAAKRSNISTYDYNRNIFMVSIHSKI